MNSNGNYLENICPLDPDYNSYGTEDDVLMPNERMMNDYLPEYRKLFPHFSLEDIKAVRLYRFEWYDGSGAPYLYSNKQDGIIAFQERGIIFFGKDAGPWISSSRREKRMIIPKESRMWL